MGYLITKRMMVEDMLDYLDNHILPTSVWQDGTKIYEMTEEILKSFTEYMRDYHRLLKEQEDGPETAD